MGFLKHLIQPCEAYVFTAQLLTDKVSAIHSRPFFFPRPPLRETKSGKRTFLPEDIVITVVRKVRFRPPRTPGPIAA